MTGRGRLLPTLLLIALTQASPVGANPGPQALKVDFLDGYVELGTRGRSDRRERRGAGVDLDKNQVKLEETLHLRSGGSIWYPRLVRYRASGEVAFLQRLDGADDLILPAGDLSLHFLEKKPYGATLFARVLENEVEETFARNYESRLTTYGGAVRMSLGPVPFQARYTHRFRDRTGNATVDLEERADEVEFMGAYRFRPDSGGDIRYVYSDQELRGQPSTRHDFVANNVTYFDTEKHKRLMATVRYYEWSGLTDTSEASAFGTYDWEHTDHFASNYHLDFAHREFDQQSNNLYNARAGVSHQLYGSLGSSASVFANVQDAKAGTVGEYGVDAAERYTKRLGRWGRLSIGLGPNVRLQQLRPDQDTSFVLDERVTFPFSDISQLRQLDVEVASIVVTSTDGATLYQENFDYRVTVIDRRTEIQRIDTGAIPAGGQIFVDYRYESRSDNDVISYGVRSDLEWSYRDWGSLFVDIRTKREDVVSGRSDRRLDDRDRQEFGFRTRQRWVNALISFDWEKWDGRSSNGNLQTATLTTPWPGRWRAGLSVTHRMRNFKNPSEDLDSWRVNGSLNLQFGKNGVIEIGPEYANENWDGANGADGRDLEAVGGSATVRWLYRSLEFRGSASVHHLERPGVQGLHSNFFFWVRRHF